MENKLELIYGNEYLVSINEGEDPVEMRYIGNKDGRTHFLTNWFSLYSGLPEIVNGVIELSNFNICSLNEDEEKYARNILNKSRQLQEVA